jgi:hypothetical protein
MSTGGEVAACIGIGLIFAGMIATLAIGLMYAIREGSFH